VNVATSKKEGRHDSQHPETFWLVDWSLVTIIGSTMPPRDHPNDDDDDEDEEDEKDKDRHDEPAVVREPDDD
jgi:hypothetical protein